MVFIVKVTYLLKIGVWEDHLQLIVMEVVDVLMGIFQLIVVVSQYIYTIDKDKMSRNRKKA